MKYLYNYLGSDLTNPVSYIQQTRKMVLTRAATLHPHYSEAANRAGKMKLAYALTNRGIGYQYDSIPKLGGTKM